MSESLTLNAVENPILKGLWRETEIWCTEKLLGVSVSCTENSMIEGVTKNNSA